MPLQPLYLAPGICKSTTDYASGKTFGYQSSGGGSRVATGRYVDGDNVRFVAGFPEKIGGNVLLASGMTGIPRTMKEWLDANGVPRVGIGTSLKLYYMIGTVLHDITPFRTISTGSLASGPFSVTNGSNLVVVADTTSIVRNGDYVLLQAAAAAGGVLVNGYYLVSANNPGTGYTITLPFAAPGSGTGGGATTYGYPRKNLAGSAFSTVNGSPVVEVVDSGHGLSAGDYMVVAGLPTIGGIAISGEYPVTVIDANTYTITDASNATSTATGTGTSTVQYRVSTFQAIPIPGEGYGSDGYGLGEYGQSATVPPFLASGWMLAPYGNQLLAAPVGGTIYVYNTITGGVAYPLLNAPASITTLFVTPERFLFALGINGSNLELAWPDQNDYTQWTSLPTNTAESGRTLGIGSYLLGGTAVSYGNSLIFSDRAVYQATYTGDNSVYATPFVADNAGLVGPLAMVAYEGACFWMSQNDFYQWNGSVSALPSDDIRDHVFRNLNPSNISKCVAGLNPAKKEVWFFYPSLQSIEIDSYVIYHTDQQCWSIGSISRSGWTGNSLLISPLAVDVNGNVYQHEIGVDDNGAALDAYIETAAVDISNGTNSLDVMGFIPDFERFTGSALLTVNTRYYPQDTNVVSGPYTMTSTDSTPRIDIRADGKMVGFRFESNEVGGDFRLALPRFDIQPSGARR